MTRSNASGPVDESSVLQIDADNEVIGQSRSPTPHEGGPDAVTAAMESAIREAAEAAEVEPSALRGVGVGSPGEVDIATGAVANAKNLPAWTDSYPLGTKLAEALGTRVAVGNDVGVATTAEYELGAGHGHASVLGVFWGTGVGGGLILDGKLYSGTSGSAGESWPSTPSGRSAGRSWRTRRGTSSA